MIEQGKKCLIIDDVLATGGTLIASGELVRKSGGIPVGAALLYEIKSKIVRNNFKASMEQQMYIN